MKRRKRIRVEEEVLIRWHENGQDIQRREIRVRYVKPPTIPEVPDRKLHFSLVPCPLWKLNLRAFIKKAQWDNLREHIIDIRGPRCETCGAKEYDGLHAHEEWHYDTDGVPGLAHLMGIGIQCKRCHQAEHYGLTQMFHMQGHISDEELEEIHQHYCTVNGVSRAVMKADHDAERERWVALNKFPWEVVWGPFAAMLGKRGEVRDFNIQIHSKYANTITTEPTKDYGPLPTVGLPRPFGTRTDCYWAVSLVEPLPTKRINDDCKVTGFLFISRGQVPTNIHGHAEALVGKMYKDWRTLPNNLG
jgi:hypothetical protein